MGVAEVVRRRSRCVPSQVGCVIVSAVNAAAAVAYNGPPARFEPANRTMAQCDVWCPHASDPNGGREDYLDCVSSHAEANALMQSERDQVFGGTIYGTRVPCFMCAKMIANSGVVRAVFPVSVDDADRVPQRSIEILRQSGVEVTLWRI